MAPAQRELERPPGAGGDQLISRDPASGEMLGSVPVAAPERIEGIVRSAGTVQPLWALLRVADRARYMRRVAQAIIDERDELVETISREQGRPSAEVLALEILPAIDALLWIADEGGAALALRRVGVPRAMFPLKRARVAFEPFGVIGVIGAGSAPFAQPLGQIAGALLAGNGVVFKPARRACLAGEGIIRVLGRASLPEGLVRVVHGGAQAGVALAQAPVDKVLFTGSPSVGRAVARACVSRDTEVTVEMGGKDAMLVLADAQLSHAARCALWAGCAGAGQARGAVERVYVARAVYEPLLECLVARAKLMRVGDPREPGVQVGPLASKRRLGHVEELVDEAVADGARLLCGGPTLAGDLASATPGSSLGVDGAAGSAGGVDGAPGWAPAYYAPAVLADVSHRMRIMREPIDGPVLGVMAVNSIDEALQLANAREYSLGASVWSADRYQALRIARELRAGMVWLNDHLPSPAISRGPWGAFAGGGLGKTLGLAGLRACAQEKLIAHDPARFRGMWWAPYDEVSEQAARGLVLWRSARSSDRERAWRSGAVAFLRNGARALARR
jgi:succinate-semialdehyde dehydrogenase/glutarate-semialdehyde dehydrogenase